MRALTKKVFKDITHRKLRSALTILGVAIGIIGLSAIGIASSQFKSSFQYSTTTTSQPDIVFFTGPAQASLVDTLRTQANVQTAQAQGYVNTRWSIDSRHIPFRIIGVVDFQHVQINRFELVEGSLPGPGQIALEYSDRALDSVHTGDQIDILINGAYQKLTISGFMRTQGLASAGIVGRAQAYMNEQDVETLFHTPGVTSFMVRVNNADQADATAKQLSHVFQQHNILVFAVYVGRDTSVSDLANGVFATMNLLSLIAILLSVCLLLGTIMSLITEQMQYIGTMKAIGARRGQILRHYMSIVAAYGVIGTFIGLLVGIPCGYLLANYLGELVSIDIGPLAIPPLLLLEALVIGIGTPLLAAALPTYIGTRITVRKALNAYGVESGKAQGEGGWWATTVGRVLAIFPQTVQFGTRGLFRRRVRILLTLLTLTTAGAAFLAVQTASYSFDTFLNQVFTTYHFDVMVSTADPQPLSAFQHILASVPGITRVEGLTQDTLPTKWGNATLTGVQINTRIYQPQLLSGRWFNSTDQSVVIISKDAADKSGLGVGDTITLNTSLNTATWHIIGIAKDYSGIGPGNLGVLVAPITQVDAFMHVPSNYTEIAMIQAASHSDDAVNALANRVDDAISRTGLLPDVTTAAQRVEQDHAQYQIIYTLMDIVAVIIALVGAIGLSNTLAMSVLERRREIGILRSMGAVSRKVAQVFWSEGIALGVFSWLLALLFGLPAAYGFVQVQARLLVPIPFAFNPLNLIWMLGFILLIATLASVGPVFGSTKVKIARTLRYE